MKTVEVKMQMPEFPGYEYTGEYRTIKRDELGLITGTPQRNDGQYNWPYPVLRKVEKWEPLTVQRAAELLVSQEMIFWRYSVDGPRQYGKVHSIQATSSTEIRIYFQDGRWCELSRIGILATEKGE